MIAFFYTGRAAICAGDGGKVVHVEDDIGLTRACREHLESVELGADFVNNLIR